MEKVLHILPPSFVFIQAPKAQGWLESSQHMIRITTELQWDWCNHRCGDIKSVHSTTNEWIVFSRFIGLLLTKSIVKSLHKVHLNPNKPVSYKWKAFAKACYFHRILNYPLVLYSFPLIPQVEKKLLWITDSFVQITKPQNTSSCHPRKS